MPDTQAMPESQSRKGKPDGTNVVKKGPESGGGDYPNEAGGHTELEYFGPKNDGSEGGETVRKD